MKIVVIDDEMCALQSFLTESISYDVEYKFFTDNEAAIIDYVAKNNVDAVFTDIGMPSVNGLDLAQKLIGLRGDMAIVFITGMPVTMSDLNEKVRANTLGFLYKPYNTDRLAEFLNMIKKRSPALTVTMFDGFDCFADGKLILFTSAKAKELFALLLTYNGKSLPMTDAITRLWENADVEKAKILYRNAVFRLRKTLSAAGINCVGYERAMLTLDKTNISCDYWDYLRSGVGAYRGEFCKNYDWSIEYLPELDWIAERSAQGRTE